MIVIRLTVRGQDLRDRPTTWALRWSHSSPGFLAEMEEMWVRGMYTMQDPGAITDYTSVAFRTRHIPANSEQGREEKAAKAPGRDMTEFSAATTS